MLVSLVGGMYSIFDEAKKLRKLPIFFKIECVSKYFLDEFLKFWHFTVVFKVIIAAFARIQFD